ncbi:hypothetical protein [Flavobacterium sp. XS2P14]|uniref:hypothetical protein n=1 Tax=Flavobacterium sp. XS2P14 TaxID=3401735 RepID=UPI003AB009F1
MKNLKTTMLTAIFALCCYANANAQTAPAQQTAKNKSSVVVPNPTQLSVNPAKTPPPVQDWKNKRNIHQYPGGGHAVTDGKSGTIPIEDVPQPQQTVKGIKDPAVKSCGSCGMTGKAKAGGNPQATAKEKVNKE